MPKTRAMARRLTQNLTTIRPRIEHLSSEQQQQQQQHQSVVSANLSDEGVQTEKASSEKMISSSSKKENTKDSAGEHAMKLPTAPAAKKSCLRATAVESSSEKGQILNCRWAKYVDVKNIPPKKDTKNDHAWMDLGESKMVKMKTYDGNTLLSDVQDASSEQPTSSKVSSAENKKIGPLAIEDESSKGTPGHSFEIVTNHMSVIEVHASAVAVVPEVFPTEKKETMKKLSAPKKVKTRARSRRFAKVTTTKIGIAAVDNSSNQKSLKLHPAGGDVVMSENKTISFENKLTDLDECSEHGNQQAASMVHEDDLKSTVADEGFVNSQAERSIEEPSGILVLAGSPVNLLAPLAVPTSYQVECETPSAMSPDLHKQGLESTAQFYPVSPKEAPAEEQCSTTIDLFNSEQMTMDDDMLETFWNKFLIPAPHAFDTPSGHLIERETPAAMSPETQQQGVNTTACPNKAMSEPVATTLNLLDFEQPKAMSVTKPLLAQERVEGDANDDMLEKFWQTYLTTPAIFYTAAGHMIECKTPAPMSPDRKEQGFGSAVENDIKQPATADGPNPEYSPGSNNKEQGKAEAMSDTAQDQFVEWNVPFHASPPNHTAEQPLMPDDSSLTTNFLEQVAPTIESQQPPGMATMHLNLAQEQLEPNHECMTGSQTERSVCQTLAREVDKKAAQRVKAAKYREARKARFAKPAIRHSPYPLWQRKQPDRFVP